MNKLPAKQIYLLTIIILGITSLSVYSTYSIFTLESETSDIVSIQTSNVLNVETETYQYKQLQVPAGASVSTDVDIYNNYNYNLCYSVWYKIVPSEGISFGRVSVYQENDILTTSGALDPITSRRIKITIKNNNDSLAKVNIGIAYSKNEGTCALNISRDKSLVSSTKDTSNTLSATIIKDTEIKNSQSNYITYTNNKNTLNISPYETIYISNKYTFKDEIFTLTNPSEISIYELNNYNYNNNYYICINSESCRNLYRINEISDDNKITKYDIMVGYLSGESGIRKINQNYYYYGDNPNNYIYYNCQSKEDLNTCELWRIIGIFYDSQEKKYATKIIKDESIGLYQYSSSNNTWSESNILKTLKTYKLFDENNIEDVNYKQEIIKNNEISTLNTTNKTNIMLMNINDFINTSVCTNKKITEFDTNCQNNNWLNKNYNEEWTMTIKYEEPYIDEETEEKIIPDNNKVYSIGSGIKESIITNNFNIRPVLYIKDTVTLVDGNGTFEKPYVIE